MAVSEEIEQSFGTGPEHRPIDELVVAGRKRLRRRRVAEVVAAVAVVGVVGSTYSMVTPDAGGDRGTPPVAGDPSGAVGESTVAGVHPEEVRLTDDGTLLTGEDVEVLDRVDNPAHVSPPEYSVAVDVRIDGERQWMLLTTGPGSGAGGAQLVDEHTAQTFHAWVEEWAESEMGLPVEGNDASPEGGQQRSNG